MDRQGAWVRLALLLFVVPLVGAIEVHTPKEVEAANGTDTRLKCTFTTSAGVTSMLAVTWTYKPQPDATSEQVFYYHEQPYPPVSGTFRGRAVWDGNINRNDASIVIRDLMHSDSGTFACQVKNPPDTSGLVGEIQLRVVDKVMWSEMLILGLAVGGACLVVLLLVMVVMLVRYRMKSKKRSTELSMEESKEKNMVLEKMLEPSDTGI
ncbi:myelin protein zero-like protein 2 [Ambystoma mexicanum]|uniref:myelin protein zero-like protein 2 n=1 Tax=Ambystoma mexicanum TaxID=8296 RepID=UPI0037E972B0